MTKIERTVIRETKFLSIAILIFSILAQAIFFILGKYNYTVLLGFIYGGGLSVINFWLLGMTIEDVSNQKDDNDIIRKKIQFSYKMRSLGLIVFLILGIIIPIFDTWAVVLSVIFPKIYYLITPFFRKDLER